MDLFSSGAIKQHDIEIDGQDLIQISAISEILNAFKKISYVLNLKIVKVNKGM